MRSAGLLAVFLLLAPLPGVADPYTDARQAYLAGDYATALAVLEPMARAGDAAARNIMADAYDEGNGVAQDHQRALELYRSAAAQGLAMASYNLGVLLAQGRPGIPADVAQAIVHYEEAMAQDYPAAFNNRGILLAKGLGSPADLSAAAELYRLGYELGDLNAADNLADLLRRGEGIEQDEATALALWQDAASKGHGPSMNNLGAMYDNGIIVAQDPVAAEALYLMAARAGAVQAGLNLSINHAERGDAVTALAWCLWAEKRGADPCATPNPDLLTQAKRMAKTLTP